MSWSGTCQIKAGTKFDETLLQLRQMPIVGGDNAPEETGRAVYLAVDVVNQIIHSYVLGTPPGLEGGNGFYVSISGHANVDHRAPDGWTNDMITITIQQVPHHTDKCSEEEQRI